MQYVRDRGLRVAVLIEIQLPFNDAMLFGQLTYMVSAGSCVHLEHASAPKLS